MDSAYSQSTSEVLAYFSVSESQGLTDAQITASREKHGRNGKEFISWVSLLPPPSPIQ